MDPRSRVSVGFAPNNWILPEPSSTQINLENDPRLDRIMTALAVLLPEL